MWTIFRVRGAARCPHGGQGGELPHGRGPLPHRLLVLGQVLLGMFSPWSRPSGTSGPLPDPFIYRSSLIISYSAVLHLSPKPLPSAPSRRAGRGRPAREKRITALGDGDGAAGSDSAWGLRRGRPRRPDPRRVAAFSRQSLQSVCLKREGAEREAARWPSGGSKGKEQRYPAPLSPGTAFLSSCWVSRLWKGSKDGSLLLNRLVSIPACASEDAQIYFVMGTELDFSGSSVTLHSLMAVNACLCSSCNRNRKPSQKEKNSHICLHMNKTICFNSVF